MGISNASLLGFLLLIFSGIASGFSCYLIIRYDHHHAHLSHDLNDGPQKVHFVPTPRIGGIGLMLGLLFAGIGVVPVQLGFSMEQYIYLILASIPAFLGGLTEDITKRVGVITRLMLTFASSGIAIWLLGASINRMDIPGFDALFNWMPFSVILTVIAVGGVANAVNIIDGFNGLAGGYSVVVLAALSWVAGILDDTFLMTTSLSLIGALIGYLIWNYPKGRIFLGDGGAYLLGFLIAEISVLLVVRHPEVSAWFPLFLLAYPIFETLFTMVRRKIMKGYSVGQPDFLHLHQLIYRRLLGDRIGVDSPEFMTLRNNRVAPYFWLMACCVAIPALLLWRETRWLVALAFTYGFLYSGLYFRLASGSMTKAIETSHKSP
ncbi:MAG: glycosyltransferase family 4 protein [Betaproteobacteria bacterium]|nr:glycosyltransferase family 4 protein [Betaproteobacteria bacterium]